MADVRTLKDRAAEAAARGKLEEAADLYRQALRDDPDDVGTRRKLADVLRRDGRTVEAIEAYRAVVDRLARDGLLLNAIGMSKTILELDPAHGETQAALAELYARRAAVEGARPLARTAVAAATPAAEPTAPARLQQVSEAASRVPGPLASPVTGFARVQLAAADAAVAGVDEEGVPGPDEPAEEPAALEVDGEEPLAAAPPTAGATSSSARASTRLPRFPIFSDLSPEAFVALTRAVALRRARGGEAVLREGDTGTSFYVVASGRLAVSKRDDRGEAVVLAHLGEGDFFGEMAFLSGAPRVATVVALEPCELLEFRAEALLEVARVHPHVAASIRSFYRQRLLANAMAMSPVFRPFAKNDRKRIIGRFHAREVSAGEKVILEGEPSDGLYVVLDGALDVVKRRGAGEIVVGQLRAGDVFGEMSCLRKAPASATVVVRRGGSLLKLPRREFDDVIVSYPQILELVADLSEERWENLDAILTGHAQWTEDGLVLI